MKLSLCAGITAVAVVAASYGLVAATNQTAAAETTVGPGTELPAKTVGDVVVDDSHQQVFVSMPTVDSIVVTDLDGRIQSAIDVQDPWEMELSPDDGTLYVAERGARSITRIHTSTHELTRSPLPDSACPTSLAFTGGQLWFSYGPGGCSAVSLGVMDPTTSKIRLGILTDVPGKVVRAMPDRPDRTVLFNEAGDLRVYDVSAEPPAVVAQLDLPGSECHDAALINGGDKVVTTCEWSRELEVFHTADLSPAPGIVTGRWPRAVAASRDGEHLVAGVKNVPGCEVYVRNVERGTPGVFLSSFDFGWNHSHTTYALAYSATGRVIAAREEHTSGNATLHVLTDRTRWGQKTKCPTKATFQVLRKARPYQGTVGGFGSLGHPAPAGATISVTRRDRTGAHDLGTFPVKADGTHTVTDTPPVTGPVVYSVTYAGDETHGPGGAKDTAVVHPLAYDVNADGRAETIVGAPGEDIGSTEDAGMFHVLYGAADGASGSGSKAYHQDTPGVPGDSEPGDQLGHANASGDFDGDGYADVAISAPGEDLGSTVDAGAVWVFYGSAAGLRTDNVTTLTLDHTYLGGTPDVRFGHALAAGDFNSDGRDDLAIGAPGGEAVFVAPGTVVGLAPDHIDNYDEDTPDVPGVKRDGDKFGWSLAALDIGDGDMFSKLAVGAPGDSDDHGYPTGSVTVLSGGNDGLLSTPWGHQRWTKDSSGVPGEPAPFGTDSPDRFGHSVAYVDMTGDGFDDLAIGAPGAPAVGADGVKTEDAGTVTVLYSYSGGIDTRIGIPAAEVTQLTPGVPGKPGTNDQFGAVLAAGDADGDGAAELAAYSPGDTLVSVVPGGSDGLVYGSARGWTQNSPGIPGVTEPGDSWGGSLRFADIRGAGHHALIVGADGENDGKGAITVVYATSAGLTGTGSKYFSQYSTGIAGTPENGDRFGAWSS